MTPKATSDTGELDGVETLARRASFMALICKLSGVAVSQYETWLDSMSPEYFAIYCDSILDEDNFKLLTRAL